MIDRYFTSCHCPSAIRWRPNIYFRKENNLDAPVAELPAAATATAVTTAAPAYYTTDIPVSKYFRHRLWKRSHTNILLITHKEDRLDYMSVRLTSDGDLMFIVGRTINAELAGAASRKTRKPKEEHSQNETAKPRHFKEGRSDKEAAESRKIKEEPPGRRRRLACGPGGGAATASETRGTVTGTASLRVGPSDWHFKFQSRSRLGFRRDRDRGPASRLCSNQVSEFRRSGCARPAAAGGPATATTTMIMMGLGAPRPP